MCGPTDLILQFKDQEVVKTSLFQSPAGTQSGHSSTDDDQRHMRERTDLQRFLDPIADPMACREVRLTEFAFGGKSTATAS
jgi:hypothetical protein